MADESLGLPALSATVPISANDVLRALLALPEGAPLTAHPEDVDTWKRWLEDRSTSPPDIRLQQSDSTYRWFRCTQNTAESVIAVDITDLKASAGHFQACLQALPDLLFELNHEGRYLDYHSPPERLFAPPQAFLGRTIAEIMPEELSALFDAAIARTIAQPTSTQTVQYSLPLDGGIAHYEARFTTSPANTIICCVRENTSLVEAQAALTTKNHQLQQSNEELQDFAYVASHDLKQPLRMVSEFMKLLKADYEEQLDDTAKTYIKFATDGAERMSQMVESLLEVSRVGTAAIKPQSVDTRRALATITADFGAQIAETGATISSEDLAPIWADPNQFRMLLGNLIANALKFHRPAVPPIVTVRCSTNGTTTTLSVQDNGIGIEPKHQHKVFGMFQRLHTHAAYKGTGMGLALCKRVADRMDGTLRVESDGVSGSTFIVTVPNAPA